MNNNEAIELTGGLSNPSKMPGKGWGIPTHYCKIGSRMATVEGSVCAKCYAKKGAYRWSNVQHAYQRRHDKWLTAVMEGKIDQWIEAMAHLIQRQKYFRWFDSGDLQNLIMMKMIMKVVNLTPDTKHWLVTKEKGIIGQWAWEAAEIRNNRPKQVPENLTIRLSSAMIDQGLQPSGVDGIERCNTISDTMLTTGHLCPAPTTNGECDTCRACWDRDIPSISYNLH